MTVTSALPVVNYPKVLPDNSLEFDPTGPVPKAIPYFKQHPEIPWRFIPLFENCSSRCTQTRKLNACDTCQKTREVWYCNKFNKDVFPITCAGCEERDAY